MIISDNLSQLVIIHEIVFNVRCIVSTFSYVMTIYHKFVISCFRLRRHPQTTNSHPNKQQLFLKLFCLLWDVKNQWKVKTFFDSKLGDHNCTSCGFSIEDQKHKHEQKQVSLIFEFASCWTLNTFSSTLVTLLYFKSTKKNGSKPNRHHGLWTVPVFFFSDWKLNESFTFFEKERKIKGAHLTCNIWLFKTRKTATIMVLSQQQNVKNTSLHKYSYVFVDICDPWEVVP